MANIRPAELQETLERVREKSVANARTALPGVIQSFDPDTVTCVVSLCSKSSKPVPYEDIGKTESMDFPLLVDLPVVFPHGGGVTLTFPLAEGDECLVVFSDRCIDFWWQNGGVQELVDWRSHDLSDAFVIPGPQSQAKKITGISTTAAQLRTDDGSAFIELAPGGAVNITSPQITFNGPLQVNGTITSTGDQTAAGISQTRHTHGGVESGGSNTGAPQ
ncbi:Gp138 family membrane-puncturing spike protein [Raoultella sp. T31]|uniref:Gp138 family membrane-puncturing spike protein n=1 Tax=Raoultella sp. T31 TaxID=2054594 RepID=UPI000C288883|nr:translation initiation factor IF-2 [Raoultella sp. T31]